MYVMDVKCAECGKFIPVDSILDGAARYHFEPLSELGPEVGEWICLSCNTPAALNKHRAALEELLSKMPSNVRVMK